MMQMLGIDNLLIGFGWNAKTIGAMGAIFFTILVSATKVKQGATIFKEKSGQSFSSLFTICFLYVYIGAFVYGFDISRFPLILQGILRGSVTIPLLVGLWMYKGYNKQDWVLAGVLTIIIFIMLLTPYKRVLFSVISIAGIVTALDMPYQIWKERSRGVVELVVILAFLIQNLFWMAYGIAIAEWPLIGFMAVCILIAAATLVLWVYFPKNEEEH